MINTKAELKQTLIYEKQRYHVPRLWFLYSLLGVNEKSLIWKYQRRLRIWEYHLNKKHIFRCKLYKLFTIKYGRKLGFSIRPNIFDKGLKIMHIGSILVNGESKVGKNCVLHINSALVSTNGKQKGPTLGDNCLIGIGATLIGDIVLGDEVAVGAGAVVTKSFKENHVTLAGVPAKIISHKADF